MSRPGGTVVAGLRDEIAASGPMPFDRFMEVVLYGPGGYFSSGALRSHREGDFLTSPEVSPLFGETLAAAVVAERERVGEPFTVVEVGAGTGSLLRPLLDALDPSPDRVVAVEVSPAAVEVLRERVPEAEVASSLDVVAPPMTGVVIANELVDNLPAAVAIRRGDGWTEVAVGDSDDGLVWVEAAARPEVARWAALNAGTVAEGARVEVQLAAGAWMRGVLGRMGTGMVLVIDYGDTSEGLSTRRAEGTVRTYRGHHLGPDPLVEPGSTDVTMDVDFSALASAALEAGASTELWRQDEYLAEWGLLDRIASLRNEEHAAAAAGDTMGRLRLRDRLTGAETLLHPRGLGDFRVLVVRK
jgi:SAM-dependent MidA family methyltransferase